MIGNVALLVLLAGSVAGCVYLLAAAWLVALRARNGTKPNPAAAVTILKPLYGEEPELFDNLATFCRQDYAGQMQIVFGVTEGRDPAVAAVERLRLAFPTHDIELVIDPRAGGSNPKVANLMNMSPRIRHGIVVVSDSDIRVAPDYLSHVVGILERMPGGAVTCLYHGIAGGSMWSRLSRMQIDGQFLPGVVTGIRLGLAHPCFGSTVALRAATLDAIGGFAAVADTLADDYEIGAAVRRRGETVAVAPQVVGHMCEEASFEELWRHEVRWASTIRTIDPVGYSGWLFGNPFPLALLGLCVGGGATALALAGAALACRAVTLAAVSRACNVPRHPYWLIPLRDLLSFAVFAAGFGARRIDWHGRRYRLLPKGALMSERRSQSP